jgi:hypothetical protein
MFGLSATIWKPNVFGIIAGNSRKFKEIQDGKCHVEKVEKNTKASNSLRSGKRGILPLGHLEGHETRGT